MTNPKSFPVLDSDHIVVRKIKEKLNASGGRTVIELFNGGPCDIRYSDDGQGLESSKIPLKDQLPWEVFIATVELVVQQGGRAWKGNARAGKLGSDKLPLDSVEGHIAHTVHGVKPGQSAFGPGFVVCAILDWAGICKNKRGYLEISPMFRHR